MTDGSEVFYPKPALPGSNAIGVFDIGVSQIGDIPPFDWRQTVISQYGNSPVLLQLIESYFAAADMTEELDSFFDLIWNVDTAQGDGLDIWGRIVGVVRTLSIQTGKFFGFGEGGTADYDTFGPGGASPFYSGAESLSNFSLTDDAFRKLILAKAIANICDGSTAALNQLLLLLFSNRGGNCYVINNGGMKIIYRFDFPLTPVDTAIIFQSGVLPTPTGVQASVMVL